MRDRWCVYRYDVRRLAAEWPPEIAGKPPVLEDVKDGRWFLLRPDGFPDRTVNGFLASARMRTLALSTNRDYAYSLALWLSFLDSRGVDWASATEEDVEEFEFWRLTDPRNESPVGTSTFGKDVAACKKFYRWAADRIPDVSDVFSDVAPPPSKRSARVRWLDPAAVSRWRDLGLRGRGKDGRPSLSGGTRNEQRDVAFYEGLYGTGLRLSEWSSIIVDEIPPLDSRRSFFKAVLADRCAKGGYGHPYWIPRRTLADVESYVEGPRALAIEKARRRGLYEALSNAVVVGASKMRHCIALPAEGGGFVDRSVNLTDPSLRLRLYRRTSHGLEPLALWLNEDGMPRAAHAWHHTFSAANDRIAHLGLSNFSCTPHMLRHSFALRWFSIGKLVYSSRLTHLSGSEARDFRSQFGDTWHLVQTMLGHRRVETTKNVYLEPFRSLDVEVLLAHAEGQYPSDLFSELFEHHPLVATDPLRT